MQRQGAAPVDEALCKSDVRARLALALRLSNANNEASTPKSSSTIIWKSIVVHFRARMPAVERPDETP